LTYLKLFLVLIGFRHKTALQQGGFIFGKIAKFEIDFSKNTFIFGKI